MSGQWIRGPEKPHGCEKPNANEAAPGSIWRCNCGLAWEIMPGNERDPDNYWTRRKDSDARSAGRPWD